jgi:hypothetical protein
VRKVASGEADSDADGSRTQTRPFFVVSKKWRRPAAPLWW